MRHPGYPKIQNRAPRDELKIGGRISAVPVFKSMRSEFNFFALRIRKLNLLRTENSFDQAERAKLLRPENGSCVRKLRFVFFTYGSPTVSKKDEP